MDKEKMHKTLMKNYFNMRIQNGIGNEKLTFNDFSNKVQKNTPVINKTVKCKVNKIMINDLDVYSVFLVKDIDFVNKIYNVLLKREPDIDAVISVEKLIAEGCDRYFILIDIINSLEFKSSNYAISNNMLFYLKNNYQYKNNKKGIKGVIKKLIRLPRKVYEKLLSYNDLMNKYIQLLTEKVDDER